MKLKNKVFNMIKNNRKMTIACILFLVSFLLFILLRLGKISLFLL